MIPATGHKAKEDSEKVTTEEATCTEAGAITTVAECETCGETFSTKEILPAKGHTPGDDVVEDTTQHVNPTCTEPGKQVLTGKCKDCGEQIVASEFEIPALGHTFGEWKNTSDGGKERTCSVCKTVEKLNANGELVDPDDPGSTTPDDPSSPDDPDTEYRVNMSTISNGSVVRSTYTAKAGETVTLTVYANAGYELESIYVRDQRSSNVSLTPTDTTHYTFAMPASRVTVYASFANVYASSPASSGSSSSSNSSSSSSIPSNREVPHAAASGYLFYDIPSSHWASGEIAWAYQNGFMSGTGTGSFNPDGTFTYQQMWMVLARLTGNRPANMTEARDWAVRNGFAEGANPGIPVTRQQLVTALYRCAGLLGRTTSANGSLAGYVDSRTVPNAARNAMTWAVTNGIISGTSDRRLNPGGTTTRAQFAVILYRYYRQIM